ncbi:MAG: hypothetical protein AVDCRST_MAG93-6149 [uncultured Chloroflexia bacterium]|uniref:Uncharacterized protein n=1 Tax=uncultured Chloroflexia bacterium TaxID=1672391 RepID=A0A6J4LEK5_9CHLR|nr:MAG: hypothetical protein AVDCRST_MAG93-6149 [uncultured Chloroflexia bacterium]
MVSSLTIIERANTPVLLADIDDDRLGGKADKRNARSLRWRVAVIVRALYRP